ncbi:hypothetical protein K438DRAFT_1881033 [Mycena galopus ATCC 62051]|nr:hypothetical protein K438DRAFT_1881033 [Mycena galopus ATCC 62051]
MIAVRPPSPSLCLVSFLYFLPFYLFRRRLVYAGHRRSWSRSRSRSHSFVTSRGAFILRIVALYPWHAFLS